MSARMAICGIPRSASILREATPQTAKLLFRTGDCDVCGVWPWEMGPAVNEPAVTRAVDGQRPWVIVIANVKMART